jgi:hypothetical protein
LLEALKAGAYVTFLLIIEDSDIEKLQISLNQYQVLFGVDDMSLQSLAEHSQVPVEQLKAIIKSPNLLKTMNEERREETLLKYMKLFYLANGSLLGFYFIKFFYLQFYFLDTVADDAKVLLKDTCSRKRLISN